MTFTRETEKNKYTYNTDQGQKVEINTTGNSATMQINGINCGSVSYSREKDLNLFLKCIEDAITEADETYKEYDLALKINTKVVENSGSEMDLEEKNETAPVNPKEELPAIEAIEWKPCRMAKLEGKDILVDFENNTILLQETGEVIANINDVGSDGLSREEILSTLAVRARIYILTNNV